MRITSEKMWLREKDAQSPSLVRPQEVVPRRMTFESIYRIYRQLAFCFPYTTVYFILVSTTELCISFTWIFFTHAEFFN